MIYLLLEIIIYLLLEKVRTQEVLWDVRHVNYPPTTSCGGRKILACSPDTSLSPGCFRV